MTGNSLQQNKRFILPVLTAVLLLVSFLPGHTQAAVPYIINFQGKMTNRADGTNVTDGNYGMQFKIYDAATNGNLLWTETWDATSTQVTVTNGVFNVKLGTLASLATVDFTGGTLYLSVNFSANGGTTYDGEMAPRKQLVSSPYAFNASNLVGSGRIAVTATSSTISAATITYNPDSSTSTPAVVVTASSNVTGPALKVVQNGSGSAGVFTGGNVGIGSTTANSTLFLQGSGSTNPFAIASSSGVNLLTVTLLGNIGISSSTPNGRLVIQGTGTGTTNDFIFTDSNNVQRVVMQDSGNVGIGTTSPAQLLSVACNMRLTGALFDGGNASGTIGMLLLSTGTTTQWVATSTLGITGGGVSGGQNGTVARWTGPTTLGIGKLFDDGTVAGSGATSTNIAFMIQGIAGGNDAFRVASSTGISEFIVHENGTVAIGTTTNTSTLFIQGTSTLPALNLFTVASSSGNAVFTITNGNNINIPSSTVTALLATDAGRNIQSALLSTSITGNTASLGFANSTLTMTLPANLINNISTTSAGNSFYVSTSTVNSVNSAVFNWPINLVNNISTGTAGTDFSISTSSAGSVNSLTINLPTAANGVRGLLNSTDWNTFNGKQAALTNPVTGIGTLGYDAMWTGTNTISTGTVIDNATVAGINASSASVSLLVQGTTTLNPFQVNTSTKISLFQIAANGSALIGTTTPSATLMVQGTSTQPSLDLFRVASSTGILGLQVTNGLNVNIPTTSATALLATDAGRNIQSVTIATGTSGTALGLAFAASTLTLNCPNATASITGCLSSGDWTTFNGKQAALSGGKPGQVAYWSSPSALANGWLSDNGSVAGAGATSSNVSFTIQGISGNNNVFNINTSTGSTIFSLTPAGSLTVNSSTPIATFVVQGTTTQPALDIFRIASSTNTTYLTVNNVGSTTVQTLSALNLTSGNCVQAAGGGLLTTTASACGSGGLSGGQNGNVVRWTSASTVGIGKLFDDGTVAGAGATSTNVAFMIQGTAGANDAFRVASSTGIVELMVHENGSVIIGSTSRTSLLFVQGTSTQPTLDLFDVASSTGAQVLTVTAAGNVGIGTATPVAALHVAGSVIVQPSTNSATAFQVENAAGAPILLVDTTPTFGATTTNYLLNPGFEVNTSGWAASGSSVTLTRVTAHKYLGLASLKIDDYSGVAFTGASTSFFSLTPAAGTYDLSFYARTDVSSSTFNTLMAGYSTSTQSSTCVLNSTFVSNLGWNRYNCTFTTSGNVTGIFIDQSDTGSRTFYVDSVQLQLGSAATPYEIGNIQLRGVITSPVSFSALSNSVTAFQIQDSTGLSNLFVADTLNGRIGIGTSTPNAMLAIQGTVGGTNNLFNIASGTGASMFSVSAWGGLTMNIASTTALQVKDLSGNSVFNVDSSNVTGNSGVDIIAGSSQAADLLDVYATGGSTKLTYVTQYGGLTMNIASSSALNILNGSGTSVLLANTTAAFVGVNSSTPTASFVVQASTTGQTLPVFNIASSTASSFMLVTFNGKVGIDTSTPIAYLNPAPTVNLSVTDASISRGLFVSPVVQSARDFRAFEIAAYSNTTTQQTFVYTGLINATTYSTSTRSSIASTLAGASTLYLNGAPIAGSNATISSSTILSIIGNNVIPVAGQSTTTNAYGIFLTAPSGALNNYAATFLGGNVGVGTSTPSTQLGLQGAAGSADVFDIASSTGASMFHVMYNGSVGINTSSPAATLAVLAVGGRDAFIITSSTRATSSTMFIATKTGNIGIGTGTPNSLFAVVGQCASFQNATAGRCTDYAEVYPASQPVDYGEVVSVDSQNNINGQDSLVNKSQSAYDQKILGIVSTNPATIVEGNSVQVMTGIHYVLDPLRPAIALAGRVPVKILTSSVVHAGDFLTSSNIPGVAMKAEHSGQVIGQALQDFDPAANSTTTPEIMVFVKPGYQVIGDPLDLNNNMLAGLSLDSAATGSQSILGALVSTPTLNGSTTVVSTSRLVAGLDVITTTLTAKSLNIDNILPALGQNITFSLPSGGHLNVGNGLTSGLSVDAAGNAVFGGSLTADSLTVNHILSPDISSLQNILAGLASQASSTQASVNNLQQQFNNFASTTQADVENFHASLGGASSSILSLQDLVKDGQALTFSGPVTFASGTKLSTITALDNGGITINGDVYFVGTPYFSTDTAGFAIIKANDTSVDITFGQAYLDQPIVNASISQNATSTAGALDLFANSVFGSDIRYIITNKSQQGFTILLNKPAPADIQFSWIALAVRSAKTFSSKDLSLPVAEAVTTSSSTMQSLGDATTTASTTLPVIPAVAGASTTVPTIVSAVDGTSTSISPASNPAPTTSPATNTAAQAPAVDPTTNPTPSNPAPVISPAANQPPGNPDPSVAPNMVDVSASSGQ